jgi:lysozyme
MSPKTPVHLTDLFRYYRKLPHQSAALVELENAILKVQPDLLNRDQPWYGTWSSAVDDKSFGAAVELIKKFEGCHLTSYMCPANVPTIGYGNTRYPDGKSVKLGETISQQRAETMLTLEINRTADILEETIPFWAEMNGNQKSALISFAFNLGAYFYGLPSFRTITRVLRNREWDQVPGALLLYRNPGSHFEEGLRRRRTEEGVIWLAP